MAIDVLLLPPGSPPRPADDLETVRKERGLMVDQDDLLADRDAIETTLKTALARGGEFAEVFVEDRRSTGISFDDRRIEELSSGRDRGAGIRVVVGETTGFAHTADLSARGLHQAAEAAAAVAHTGGGGVRAVGLTERRNDPVGTIGVYPEDIDKSTKVELLARADDAARTTSGSIVQVSAGYGDSRRRIVIANSDGLYVADDQVRTRFAVSCVASGDSGLQTGFEVLARTIGFELFDRFSVEEAAQEAARRAVRKLAARPAPSGPYPVVIKGGTGGYIFHEACGHGLEADHIVKDASAFRGRMGTKVASPLVTLVDDGTVAESWGTSTIDDEGRPAQRNVLIEDGVLTEYMWDYLRARREGRESSGNGRRQSYQDLPMVRMTNTFILPGSEDPEELISATPYGVYLAKLGGGQVNTATGDFVFGMNEAYLIEGGRITEPLRDANLIGNGPEVLMKVDAIASDFDMGPGTCGKDGQSVPVGSGQPTLRISSVTIGGTAGG
jgi:TldD protein